MSLEQYLDNYNNEFLSNDIYNNNELFGYSNSDEFKLKLNFLLENIYDIKLIENKGKRLNQQEFRKQLIDKYKKCIITNSDCLIELESAHIIPLNENNNYDINNGLLIKSNLHKTFDKYYWSINPDNLKIEINNNIDVGEISKYKNFVVNLKLNYILYNNLKCHYIKFIKYMI